MNELMNSIDAIKQKITDAEYKQLCDKMMKLNTQRKTTEKCYRVWYVNVKTTVLEDEDADLNAITKFYPKFSNKIIKLKAETVELMRSQIDEMGRACVDKKVLKSQVDQLSLPVISDHGVHYIHPLNDDILITRIEDIE